MNKLQFSLVFVSLLVLVGCKVSSNSYDNDYTYLYDRSIKAIKPSFKIFHHQTDSSKLFIQINSKDLLYTINNNDSATLAKVWVKYKLTSTNDISTILDSTIIPLIDRGKLYSNDLLLTTIVIPVKLGQQYNIEVRLRDENKDLNVVHQLSIDKRDNRNNQFYLVKSDNRILPNQFIQNSTLVQIEKSPIIKENSFLIEMDDKESSKATPPFVLTKFNDKRFNSESTDTVLFSNNKLELIIDAKKTRLTPINNLEMQSLFIYNHYLGYPEITMIKQMLDPLRYISTTNEYNLLINSENQQKSFESFWLQIARDDKAAKALIKEYYNRVEISNINFSSFKEGWKTDRGIIYIVYGQPYEVFRYNDKEVWLYGEEDNLLSIKFQFHLIKTDWSNNDFEIEKDENYKNNWYRAVDAWRQGRVK
jgi:GWxTD domain-containing protein